MAQTRLAIENPDVIIPLFGLRDEYVRRIRQEFGVNVTYRNDVLTIIGEAEAIESARGVIESCLEKIEQRGSISQAEFHRILSGDSEPVEPTEPTQPTEAVATESRIDIFERARMIEPRTKGQARYVDAIRNHDLVLCAGPAGCGKTYLAVAMALHYLRTEQIRKIVLVRPAVEAGEKLGFLPGDLLAKVNPFLRPLLDALQDMLDYDQVKRYMEHDIIEIVPLAFMRGRTLNSAFMILDEAQNTTITQMKMFLTRMGEGSKIVVTGDVTQTDLPENVRSGLTDAIARLGKIEGTTAVQMDGRDIVRHRLVREIVAAYDDGK